MTMFQEEGFESDDEKHTGKSGSLVRVDLRGSDSEEDNAAAGGGMQVYLSLYISCEAKAFGFFILGNKMTVQ